MSPGSHILVRSGSANHVGIPQLNLEESVERTMLDIQEDFYAMLGVEEAATPEEIRKAYLKLAKKLHPDRFPNDPEKRAEAQTEFSKVTRAHEVLSDAKRRDEYDALRNLAKGKLSGAQQEAAPAAQEQKSDAKQDKESWAQKHNERAMDMLKRKRFPEAETAIKEAIRLCPNSPIYHTTLAEIQLARGWKTMALNTIQMALKLDPKCHEAKQVELKLKAGSASKTTGQHKKDPAGGEKKGFLDQLKELLNKKS